MAKKSQYVLKLQRGQSVLIHLMGSTTEVFVHSEPGGKIVTAHDQASVEVEWNNSGTLYVQSQHEMAQRGSLVMHRSHLAHGDDPVPTRTAPTLREVLCRKPKLPKQKQLCPAGHSDLGKCRLTKDHKGDHVSRKGQKWVAVVSNGSIGFA